MQSRQGVYGVGLHQRLVTALEEMMVLHSAVGILASLGVCGMMPVVNFYSATS